MDLFTTAFIHNAIREVFQECVYTAGSNGEHSNTDTSVQRGNEAVILGIYLVINKKTDPGAGFRVK